MKLPSTRRPIDWERTYRRLERLRIASQQPRELPPEQARALLDARARALARPIVENTEADGRFEVLRFDFGRGRYAVPIDWVCEVTGMLEITPLPQTLGFVVGLVHLHGEVVAVADLGRLFPSAVATTASRAQYRSAHLVVLGGPDGGEVGLIADSVHRTQWLARAELTPTVDSGRRGAGDYLFGVTRDALMVLDGQALLGDERLFSSPETSRT